MAKWILSSGALMSTLVAWCWVPRDNTPLRTGMVVGLVIAIYWGWQAAAATRRVLKLKESQAKALPSSPGSR